MKKNSILKLIKLVFFMVFILSACSTNNSSNELPPDVDPETPEDVSKLVNLVQTAFRESESGYIDWGVGELGCVGNQYSYDYRGLCVTLNPNVHGMIIPDNITYLEFELFAPSGPSLGCSSFYLQEYKNENPNKYFPAKIYRYGRSANVLVYDLKGYESQIWDVGGKYEIPEEDKNLTATYTLVQTWELKKRRQ